MIVTESLIQGHFLSFCRLDYILYVKYGMNDIR